MPDTDPALLVTLTKAPNQIYSTHVKTDSIWTGMNLTKLTLTHPSFVMKFVSTNWSYHDQDSESWSCSISKLLYGTLRLDLLYWGLKTSCSLSTIQMPATRNLSESFSLSPSHPPFPTYTRYYSVLWDRIWLATWQHGWKFILLKPFSFAHQQSTVCWR